MVKEKFITAPVQVAYSNVFLGWFRELQKVQSNNNVDPNATLQFYKAQTMPYAMCEKVVEELDRVVAEVTLEPVEYSDLASTTVAVVKSDRKNIRTCGAFKVMVNPASKLHRYPILKI